MMKVNTSASHSPAVTAPASGAVVRIQPLGFPWPTIDPFLFCVHHDDAYPAANEGMGPAAPLAGRDIGQDFSRQDGWSMYHGSTVPGFPAQPHRGFETVTIVRQGLIDHADSLGAAARFGAGDVQWLTAGQGVVHSEMFPLLDRNAPNPLELFQIWLNLPASSKMSPPHFRMFWASDIPVEVVTDTHGRATEVTCVAGALAEAGSQAASLGETATPVSVLEPLAPPPDSWAARPEGDVAIWTLKMAPGAQFTLPAAATALTRRMLYFFHGESIVVDGQAVEAPAAIELRGDAEVALINGDVPAQLLMLQGRPIGEPVVQTGPFVMNTREEIAQTLADYRRTGFGGWPWPDPAPVHGRDPARFARHPDGRREQPEALPTDSDLLQNK